MSWPNITNSSFLSNTPNQDVNIGSTPSFADVYLTGVPLQASEADILTLGPAGLVGYRTIPDFATLPANSVLSTNNTGEVVGTALTNGQLLVGSTSAAPVAATLTGTSNEVIVTNSTGSITLSLPQAIATTSSPTFTDLNIVGAAQPSLLINNGTDQFNSSLITSTAQVFSNSLAGDGAIFTTGGTGRILIGPEPGSPGSSPLEITSTFAEFFVPLSTTGVAANEIVTSNSAGTYTGIALSNGELLIGSNAAAPVAATLTGTANEIIVTNSTGSITLSLPQAIATTSSPTFTGLNLSSVANNNALTSLLVLNSAAVDYRTVASLGIPSTNSTVTYQGLILQGTTDSVIQLQTGGYIALAGTPSYLFTNTVANDLILQNTSSYNILLGVGTGVSQISIRANGTQNNAYIYGGLTTTIVAYVNAGTGASATITASQTGGFITLNTGSTGTTASGIQAVITLPLAPPTSIWGVNISPQNLSAASVSPFIFAAPTSSVNFVIDSGTALTFGTTYIWNWSICL